MTYEKKWQFGVRMGPSIFYVQQWNILERQRVLSEGTK